MPEARKESEKSSSIPGANWTALKRSKPWSNKKKEAKFEKKIKGLDEAEKDKSRKEKKTR